MSRSGPCAQLPNLLCPLPDPQNPVAPLHLTLDLGVDIQLHWPNPFLYHNFRAPSSRTRSRFLAAVLCCAVPSLAYVGQLAN